MSKKNKKNKNMEGTPNTGMTNSANPKAEKTASDYTKPAAENVKDSKTAASNRKFRNPEKSSLCGDFYFLF